MMIEEGELSSRIRGLAEKELAIIARTNLLVFPLPLPFMDVELLRRLCRALLRPLRDVGLHDMHQVKVTLKSRSYFISHEAIRCNENAMPRGLSGGAGVVGLPSPGEKGEGGVLNKTCA